MAIFCAIEKHVYKLTNLLFENTCTSNSILKSKYYDFYKVLICILFISRLGVW